MKILSLSPRLSILLCSAIVASSLGNQVFIAATPLDEQLLLLSKGISSQLRGKGVRRLAIADFSSIDQGQTALTRYLTEQFTTTLVTEQERTFQLVDRNTVLAELKSQNKQKEEGLLDAATLSKFGKLAGVDSVLIGTVTTTSFALELNIKVLEREKFMEQLRARSAFRRSQDDDCRTFRRRHNFSMYSRQLQRLRNQIQLTRDQL